MMLPSTMRQIEFSGSGGPDVIRLVQAPVPEPGPGQVLVQVAFAGVNRPDCLQRAGGYPPPPGETGIPGLEISGTVAAIGKGVSGWKISDEICALVGSGGYAHYCLAAAELCFLRPRALSLLEAAGVPENYFTVYDNVFTRGRLVKGETLLVHGGSSGIGATAIQLAAEAGAIVIATAGSTEKCQFCRQAGAHHAIDYRSEDFVAAVKGITDGRGADVILDMVGGEYIGKNVSLLALDGRLVQIAFLQGSKFPGFDMRPVMMRRLTITGSTLRPRTLAQKAEVARMLRANVWPLLEVGKALPRIFKVFPLSETRAAHELMESSAHMGKIMLAMD